MFSVANSNLIALVALINLIVIETRIIRIFVMVVSVFVLAQSISQLSTRFKLIIWNFFWSAISPAGKTKLETIGRLERTIS